MTTVFLYTFFVGFGLTMISAVLGAVDIDQADPGRIDKAVAHGDVSSVSPVNFQTVVAFLMGFGGVGYIITRLGWAGYLIALPAAVLGGWAAGWLIFRWLRFLVRGERPLPPTTYTGIVGQLTVGIREGGTGEIMYTQHGTRTVASARSADGSAIEKGEQVVILRYEKGIAYVQPLQALMQEEQE